MTDNWQEEDRQDPAGQPGNGGETIVADGGTWMAP